jgi:hypothetical protein
MVDPNQPPVYTDADLANLTYEQLAALINEGHPEDFYNEAMAFDGAADRLRQLMDDFTRETKQLEEYVSGEILEAVERVAVRYNGWIDSVLEPMIHPGYAAALRNAGDALSNGQRRLLDLQQQNAAVDPNAPPVPEQGEQTRQQALQILRDIGTAYRDIGGMFTPLPETTAKNNVPVTGEGPGANGPGNGDGQQYVNGRFRPDTTFVSSEKPGNQHFVTHGGSGEFQFGGGPPPGVYAATMLGRPGASGLYGVPAGQPGAHEAVEPQLLQETTGEQAAPAALLMSGVPGAGVFGSGVLGRPETKKATTGKRRQEDVAEESTEDAEVLAALSDDERPETVSTTHDLVRTATHELAPAERAVPEIRTVAATTAAIPVEKPELPAVAHGVAALTVPSFDLNGGVGAPLDPVARGMHMPVTTPGPVHEVTAELTAVREPVAGSMTTDAQTMAPGTATGANGMPMMPMGMGGGMGGGGMGMGMGMGMGGMRGGGGQDRERFAEVPVTPEAEVWDPSRATSSALGRKEPDPEPSKPSEPCPEQSDVEAAKAAALAAILGKPGDKRS